VYINGESGIRGTDGKKNKGSKKEKKHTKKLKGAILQNMKSRCRNRDAMCLVGGDEEGKTGGRRSRKVTEPCNWTKTEKHRRTKIRTPAGERRHRGGLKGKKKRGGVCLK